MLLSVSHLSRCPAGLSPTHFEKEENESDRGLSGDDTGELLAHRRSLSDAKLAALCTEVWPVLALIGGVDNGLRAGGLCLHKPSGRRAILLGVLKEGSSLAKLQWEEADLSVRYHNYIFICSLIYDSVLVFLNDDSLISIKQFLYFLVLVLSACLLLCIIPYCFFFLLSNLSNILIYFHHLPP